MLIQLLLLGATVYYLYYHFFIRGKHLPPGPTPLPIVGNALSIDAKNPGKTLNKFANEYGGICTVWTGNLPNVIISDFDMFHDAFVTQGDALADRGELPIMDMFLGGKYGLVFIDGPFWREQRRFSLHVLRDFGFGRNLMEEKINVEIDRLLEHLGNGRATATENIFNRCIGSIIANIIMGERYQFENDEKFERLKSINEEMLELFGTNLSLMLNAAPWLRHVPLFGHFSFDAICAAERKFRACFMPIIEATHEKVKQNPDAEPDNFMVAYLTEMERREAKGENDGSFSIHQLYASLGDLWGAGMETTSTTLEWAIFYMSEHPEIQAKIHDEIDRVLGDRRVTMKDKNDMPFVSATVTEVQRCGNIIPMNLIHSTNRSIKVGGYFIPKGTIVIGQMSAIHENEKYFKNAQQFNPQRFIDEPSSAEKVTPFSLGKRQCLGESLARMELFMVFTTLMQHYKVRFVEAPRGERKVHFTAHPPAHKIEFEKR